MKAFANFSGLIGKIVKIKPDPEKTGEKEIIGEIVGVYGLMFDDINPVGQVGLIVSEQAECLGDFKDLIKKEMDLDNLKKRVSIKT